MNTQITTTCRVMSNIAIVNNMTATRAKVIAYRTSSLDNGIVKSAMINELKTKLANGIAHFIFAKKNGEIREAWGTTILMLRKANGVLSAGKLLSKSFNQCLTGEGISPSP